MLLSAVGTNTNSLRTNKSLKKGTTTFRLDVESTLRFKKESDQAFKKLANSFSHESVTKGNNATQNQNSQINGVKKVNAIKEEVKKRIIDEAGILGQEMIDQADVFLTPIQDSLEYGKLSSTDRLKLKIMKSQLVKIKQKGTLWLVGKIAVNNKSISLNVSPSKVSSYGKIILRNLNLLPQELKVNVSCDFSKTSCSMAIYDLKINENLLKFQP